jgi:hypothetical protein
MCKQRNLHLLEGAVDKSNGLFHWTVSCALALVALLVLAHSTAAQQMKPVTIATKWAKDVDPLNPLPEYPRPQMVRSQWLNLNGVWQVRSGTAVTES